MESNLFKRNFVRFLILLSLIISILVFYLEEKRFNFYFLYNINELLIFLFFTLLTTIFPIAIYYSVESSRYFAKMRYLAFLGFMPSIILLVLIII